METEYVQIAFLNFTFIILSRSSWNLSVVMSNKNQIGMHLFNYRLNNLALGIFYCYYDAMNLKAYEFMCSMNHK